MKKILIIGSKGMAGHMIKNYLESRNKDEIYSTFRKKENEILNEKEFDLDAFNTEKLREILNTVKPDFVINCIGILHSNLCKWIFSSSS